MRQPINLLSQGHRQRGLLWWTVWVLALGFLALGVELGLKAVQIAQHQALERAALESLQALRAEMWVKKEALGIRAEQDQATELTRLNKQLLAQSDWVNWLQKGELGQLTGPSEVLETLASMTFSGLWLERIELVKGGPSMVITGYAFEFESVVDFAHQLEQHLTGETAFSSLETKREIRSANEGAPSHAAVFKFKLF